MGNVFFFFSFSLHTKRSWKVAFMYNSVLELTPVTLFFTSLIFFSLLRASLYVHIVLHHRMCKRGVGSLVSCEIEYRWRRRQCFTRTRMNILWTVAGFFRDWKKRKESGREDAEGWINEILVPVLASIRLYARDQNVDSCSFAFVAENSIRQQRRRSTLHLNLLFCTLLPQRTR